MGIRYRDLQPFFLLDHMAIPLAFVISSIFGILTILSHFRHILHKLMGKVVEEQYISFGQEYMFQLDIYCIYLMKLPIDLMGISHKIFYQQTIEYRVGNQRRWCH